MFNLNAEEHDDVNIFDRSDYCEDDYEFDLIAKDVHEMIFEDDNDVFSRGPPPAAKSVVESLPTHIICLYSGV